MIIHVKKYLASPTVKREPVISIKSSFFATDFAYAIATFNFSFAIISLLKPAFKILSFRTTG